MASKNDSAEHFDSFVVYDCDIGTDDAWGLLMLVKGEQRDLPKPPNGPGKYKILGVTCVQGNTDVVNGSKNALRVLQAINRTDIPVFKGCAHPILPSTWKRPRHFHGLDGLGDLEHKDEIDLNLLQKEHAVNAMYRWVQEHPNQVDFILVGPLTNFANCITMYGSEFLDKIRHVYIMGGNCRGKGNSTKSSEFNFTMDPEAAHIVLENVKGKLVLLPWETCIDGDIDITLEHRFQVLGAPSSAIIELLNRAEKAILVPKGLVKWIVCDAMLVAAYLFPRQAVAQSRFYNATVELAGVHTRGQMVLDHLLHNQGIAGHKEIIFAIHKEHWRNIISWTAGVGELALMDRV